MCNLSITGHHLPHAFSLFFLLGVAARGRILDGTFLSLHKADKVQGDELAKMIEGQVVAPKQ